MPEGKKDSKIYDLRKMEDLFECVEIVTMARGALYPVDERLASRLEKVSDALTAFSMNSDEDSGQGQDMTSPASGKVGQAGAGAGEDKGGDRDPLDLFSDFPVSSDSRQSSWTEKNSDSEDDGIIDIITGEKIK